jgi:DNA repair protein RecO (recombination protein O)
VARPLPTSADAIVLRLVDYGDSDRIVTLLTGDHGKVNAFARGARKSLKRFGGGLLLFARGEALLARRPGADLWGLDGFTVRGGPGGLLSDLDGIGAASYAVELCREFLNEHHPEPRIFALLGQALENLRAAGAGVNWPAWVCCFELRLLEALGLQPPLWLCAACGRDLPADETSRLDARAGGAVCEGCGAGRPLVPEVRRALLELAAAVPWQLPAVAPSLARRAGRASRVLVVHHLGRMPRSAEFLDRLHLLSGDPDPS